MMSKLLIVFYTVIVCFPLGAKEIINLQDLAVYLQKHPDTKEVYIKNGVYENINLVLTRINEVKIQAEVAGKVIISGKSNINIRNSDNFEFSGFHFKETWSTYLIKLERVTNSKIYNNFFDHTKGNAYSRVIGLQGRSTGNLISHNTFDGIITMGITISADENYNNTITKNVFRNIPSVKKAHPSSKDGNGMEVISIGTVSYWEEPMYSRHFNTTVSYNYFENIEGDNNEVICVKANSNTIENNFFTNNKGGVSLRFGNNNVVRDNVFYQNVQNIIIAGQGHVIEHNKIIDDKMGIQIPAGHERNSSRRAKKFSGFYSAEDITIRNNYIDTRDETPLIVARHQSSKRRFVPNNIDVRQNSFTAQKTNVLSGANKANSAVSNNSYRNARGLIKENLKSTYYFGKKW